MLHENVAMTAGEPGDSCDTQMRLQYFYFILRELGLQIKTSWFQYLVKLHKSNQFLQNLTLMGRTGKCIYFRDLPAHAQH